MQQTTTTFLQFLFSLQLLAFQHHHFISSVSAQSSAPVAVEQQQEEHCSVDGSCYFDILNDDSSDDDDEEEDSSDVDNNDYETDIIIDNLYSFLTTQRYTLPLKTLERSHLRTTHPTALHYTLSHSGNYSDSSITKAGSSQWVGRTLNAQIASDPTYTTFGSLLDIVTSGAHGGRQDTLRWMSTLFHRRELVQYHGEENEDEARYIKPCRIDLLDDNDEQPFMKQCLLGVAVEEVVSVVSNENVNEEEEEGERKRLWAEEQMRRLGYPSNKVEVVSSLNEVKEGTLFDTIIVNGLPVQNNSNGGKEVVDLKLEHVIQTYLKPGGIMYVFGEGPLVNEEYSIENNGPGEQVFGDILDLLDSVKSLSGVHPQKPPTASFIHRTISRMGLNVVTSTTFPTSYSYDDVTSYLEEAVEWIDELDTQRVSQDMKKSYYQMCLNLLDRVEDLKEAGYEEVDTGGYEYMIAAQLPKNDSDHDDDDDAHAAVLPTVETPTPYQPKEKYQADQDPNVEHLLFPPLAPGVMETYKWANGDAYDGLSARIGIPPQLKDTVIEYVKGLGIWDIILDTMKPENQMRPDSTKILTVKSPYSGQNFTWSAKRPDNFYGTSSDMHWFDAADEASHEEALRALAKGGFDEVLNAIGTYLGLDHLVSFSIGILAVTKADKGYVHVDFSKSGKKAANFLVNLQTPSDEPELTVIEEDDVGNRRRAQVKYSNEVGILNGDDAMHATNECNHRATGGVRITASIFISQLEKASLKQVAEHDRYYFPFGNMDWIFAQRGRHWNKEGTASMLDDKGRKPFEPVDAIEGCEYRVGENKEECMVHGEVRMNCYKTCGFFKDDSEYRPGEERKVVSADLPI